MFYFNSWNKRHIFEGKKFSEIIADGEIEFLVKISSKKVSYGFYTIENGKFEIPKMVFEMVKNKYPIHKQDICKIY